MDSDSLERKGRGTVTYDPSDPISNLIMVWGCQPSDMVNADTKMINDFFDTLHDRYDKRTLEIVFPNALSEMKATAGDENWEIFISNQSQ